ncbi:hypothetical protein [Amaricoccus sp.]|uniref:hypothetical protein n=1 Tax=Amaricoccus sp. TaxID=1872485 RepID=UPI002624AC61|nr:hypothetical protein [uncultured Amaricoccus sp.]
MRAFLAPLSLVAALAGCALPQPEVGRAQCVALFEYYDYVVNAFQPDSYSASSDRYIQSPMVSRQAQRLMLAGCVTSTDDLNGLEQLGATLGYRAPIDSGATIPPTAVSVGVVTSLTDVTRATVFFRGLGYGTRAIGAEGLGTRFYIGPFVSEGAMAEAIATAERAGFIAPYPTKAFRFWPW